MKTTIDIADNILERTRRLSKAESIPLKVLVEEGLSLVLERRSTSIDPVVEPVTFKGQGLSEEYRNASWSTIRDAAYAGRGA
jgi:hypothetical protein